MKARVGVLIAVLTLVGVGAVVTHLAAVHPSAVPVGGAVPVAGAVSVPSARIADSRLGLQIPGPTPAAGSVAVQVSAPGGGVASVVVSVTVVDPQWDGSLTVWPSGDARPGSSNLTFRAGRSIAGTVVAPVGAGRPDPTVQRLAGRGGSGRRHHRVHPVRSRVSGAVWAWGSGRDGQLGDGGTTDSRLPVPVFGLNQVTAVAGGERPGTRCAVTERCGRGGTERSANACVARLSAPSRCRFPG